MKKITAARFTVIAVIAIVVGIAAALVAYVTVIAAIFFLLITAIFAFLFRRKKKPAEKVNAG